MRTITKTVYTYAELPEGRAKDKARSWLIDAATGDDFWYEGVFEDWIEKLEGLGVSIRQKQGKTYKGKPFTTPAIYFSVFSSQGDGACFEASINIADFLVAHSKAHELSNKNRALYLYARENGLTASVVQSGHYSHEHCTRFEFDAIYDNDKAEKQFNDLQDWIIDTCRGYMRQIYRDLEKEYEYQTSEESLKDMADANDYTFDEYGEREG